MRRVIAILVLVVAFFASAITILGSAPATSAGSRSTQAATSRATVDRGEVKLTVSATGKIVARQQANLGFDQSGPVVEVLVTEGQQGQAGQARARQDGTAQKASRAQADDAVNAADAALQKLLRPVDPGEIAKAEANVKAAEASYSSRAQGVGPDTIKAYQ